MFLVNVFDASGTLIMQSYVKDYPGQCKVSVVAMPSTPPDSPATAARKEKGKHRG